MGVSGDDASLMPEALPARDLRELHHVDLFTAGGVKRRCSHRGPSRELHHAHVALAPQAGERKHLPHPRLVELNEALLVPAGSGTVGVGVGLDTVGVGGRAVAGACRLPA